jgi:hypothetical protein
MICPTVTSLSRKLYEKLPILGRRDINEKRNRIRMGEKRIKPTSPKSIAKPFPIDDANEVAGREACGLQA